MSLSKFRYSYNDIIDQLNDDFVEMFNWQACIVRGNIYRYYVNACHSAPLGYSSRSPLPIHPYRCRSLNNPFV